MILKNIILIAVGFFLLTKGADVLVEGASSIAKKFHLSHFMIGLTIVSIGTSLPELVVSVTSATKGFQDVTLGNVIGSNLANLLLVLGLVAMIQPIQVEKRTQNFEIPVCMFVTMLFAMLCIANRGVTRIEAILLLLLFLSFLGYTIYMAKQYTNKEEMEKEEKEISLKKSIFLIGIGILFLKVGGDFTVNHATSLAKCWGLSDKIISITILSIGTSLPELVTSVVAALKGSNDIAVGNIIGSNIFNILLIIGMSAIIRPIVYHTVYNVDIMILLFSTVLLAIFPLFPPKDKIGRNAGILYMYIYALYMVISFR